MSQLKVTDTARDRYHSLAISSVWTLSTVRQARALVVGGGALGNEVCKNLAMMGVSTIVIVDRDTVATANLTRSVFFRESDHGRFKTEVLAERIRDLNPDVNVITMTGDLEAVLGTGLLRRMDMVFSCLDSRLARRSLNRLCEKVGVAWVDGAMEDLFGEVAAFVPGDGPCYECGLTELDRQMISEARSCRGIALQKLSSGKVPTTSTMGSIVAALQVQEGMKLLHRQPRRSLAGKRLVINGIVNDFYKVEIERKIGCAGHIRFGAISNVQEFNADGTLAVEVLARYRNDTGADGYLELGREILVQLKCPGCGAAEESVQPLTQIGETAALCPTCGEMRVPETTHLVTSESPLADWTLARLGIPRLDVVEVRGSSGPRWYEMTGDLAAFPDGLEPAAAAAGH